MIIDNLKDLEIIKNALENYITNGKKALREAKEANLNPILIDIINDGIVGAEILLKDAEKEHMNGTYKKARNLIDNGEVHVVTKSEIQQAAANSNEFTTFQDEMASIDNPEYLLDAEFINKMSELLIKQRKAPIKIGMAIQNFEDVMKQENILIDEGHKFDGDRDMKDLKKLIKSLINVIPKEEETIIMQLKDRLDSIEFLLLPEQLPMHEESIYKIVSSCLPNDIDYDDLSEWHKEIIEIWNER
ncbi:hypothetical protein [Clostridium botulinum]|uniref:Uncharacterized protein n=1 Tax=Clostridium botulinum B2 450 TaxID=1379739 RepID=A0A0D1BRV4_CLOBO|nr:hypothetical protein [Clostridium botulinum]KIS21556.1 hypothetical protein N495_19290 [Clostridium botulinum B2 450]